METKFKTRSICLGMISSLFILAWSSFVFAESNTQFDKFTVADGSPIAVEEKGFAITPPQGWHVFRNRPGVTLLFEAPDEPRQKYKRTIHVSTFSGPRYTDQLEADKFATTIVRNFSESNGAIENYRIRNHLPVDLDSGVAGYLFYGEFKIGDFDMMQAHVLISSANRHYLMTFTDLAEYFNTEKGSGHLNEAWQVLGSVKIDSVGPRRFDVPMGIFVVIVIFAVGGGIFFRVRSKRAARRYGDDMKKLENEDMDDYIPASKPPKSMPPSSRMEEDVAPVTMNTNFDDQDDDAAGFDAFDDEIDNAV